MGSTLQFHPSWPEDAVAILRRAIDRHGGWFAWSRLDRISLDLVSLDGWLPRLEGFGSSFPAPAAVDAWTKVPRTEFRDHAGETTGVFDHGAVRVRGIDSRAHRRTFRGLRKLRRWTELDSVYFFGYAFATYVGVPFILPAQKFCARVAGTWRGERLEGVRVRFGAEDVHSSVQTFFFTRDGLLRRNDYVADVVGAWAAGAHGSEDYMTVDGIEVARHRIVFPRVGRHVVAGPKVLEARLDRIAVRFANE